MMYVKDQIRLEFSLAPVPATTEKPPQGGGLTNARALPIGTATRYLHQ
jgi:hypothetical protein